MAGDTAAEIGWPTTDEIAWDDWVRVVDGTKGTSQSIATLPRSLAKALASLLITLSVVDIPSMDPAVLLPV